MIKLSENKTYLLDIVVVLLLLIFVLFIFIIVSSYGRSVLVFLVIFVNPLVIIASCCGFGWASI